MSDKQPSFDQFFDVPSCHLEEDYLEPDIWKNNTNKDSKSQNYIAKPNITPLSQINARAKYPNKLAKQLRSIGVNIDVESGLEVEPVPVQSYCDLENIDLTNLVEETEEALDSMTELVDEKLDSWDPMKASYESTSFNRYQAPNYDDNFTESYKSLSPEKDISPAKGVSEDVQLYISNIPLSLTEDALRHMFSTVGPCKSVSRIRPKDPTRDTTFGFVTYNSVRIATEAIQKFNDYKFGDKCKLRVRLAHQKNHDSNMPREAIKWGGDLSQEDNSGFEDLKENLETNNVKLENVPMNTELSKPVVERILPSSTMQKTTSSIDNKPRLYVQGLKVGTSDPDLKQLFDRIGPSSHPIVVPPRKPGQYTTYGFITLNTFEEADAAIDHFHNFEYMGHRLSITYSQKHSGLGKMNEDEQYYHALYDDDPFAEDEKTQEVATVLPKPNSLTTETLSKSIDDMDKCVNCALPNARMRCTRCKAQYCNRQCQSNDWPTHKVICEMSATQVLSSLSNSPQSITKACYLKMLPARGKLFGDVVLMFPVFHVDFSVSGVLCCSTQQYFTKQLVEMETEMNTLQNTSNILAAEISEGLLCIAKYSSDDYGRAVVSAIPQENLTENSFLDLYFIDNGLKCKKQLKELIHLPQKYTSLPKQVGHFVMQGFENCISFKNDSAMFTSLNERFEQTYLGVTFDDSNEKVILTDSTLQVTVNDYILMQLLATETMTSNDTQRKPSCSDAIRGMMFADLPAKPFPDEEQFDICATELVSPQLFYGQLMTDIDMLQNLSIDLTDYGQPDMNAFTPKINEICVAKFNVDQLWYRAVVLQYNSDSTARVFFIDYGNKADVDTQNIRCIKESLLSYPRLALKFQLHDCEPISADGTWDVKALQLMENRMANQISTVKCVINLRDIVHCDVITGGQSLCENLKKQGLARQKRFMTADLPKHDFVFKTGEPFDAICVDVTSTTDMHAWVGDLASAQQHVIAMAENLVENVNKETPYEPIVGELVAAFHEEFKEWYRANVLTITNKHAKVRLIDYGAVVNIPFTCLDKIPDNDILKKQVYAVKITLQGTEQLSSDDPTVLDILKKALEFQRGSCDFSKKFNDTVMIQCWKNVEGENIMNALSSYLVKRIMETDIADFVPKTDKFDILLTHAESPSWFHGQLAEMENINAVSLVTQELMTYATNNPSHSSYVPVVNEICAGLHKEYKEWYRVCIKSISGKSASVKLIDYGDTIELDFDALLPLPKIVSSLPKQGIKLSLYNIIPLRTESWDEKCIEKIQEHLFTKCTVEKISVNGSVKVHLITQNGVDLADDLIANKLATCSSPKAFTKVPPSSAVKVPTNEEPQQQQQQQQQQAIQSTTSPTLVSRLMINEFPRHKIDSNKLDVIITNVNSPSSFQCQIADVSLVEKVEELNNEMTQLLKEDFSHYTPVVNECCAGFIVSYETFFRVVINAMNKDNAVVTALDYGSQDTVTLEDIKALPKQFSTLEMQAIDLCLYNTTSTKYTEWTSEAIDFFKNSFLNQLCTIVIKENVDNTLHVELFSNNNDDARSQLISKGYAVGTNTTKVQPTETQGADITPTVSSTESDQTTIEKDMKSSISQQSQEKTSEQNKKLDKYTSKPLYDFKNKSEVLLSHIDDINCFYAQPFDMELGQQLGELTLSISEYCEETTSPNYKPTVNTLCCGFDMGSWYRAFVKEITPVGAKVFFIDYGNHSELQLDQIRPFKDDFSQLAAVAIPMKLHNPMKIQLSTELTQEFTVKTSSQPCIVNIVKENENEIEVELFVAETGDNIYEMLKKLADEKAAATPSSSPNVELVEDEIPKPIEETVVETSISVPVEASISVPVEATTSVPVETFISVPVETTPIVDVTKNEISSSIKQKSLVKTAASVVQTDEPVKLSTNQVECTVEEEKQLIDSSLSSESPVEPQLDVKREEENSSPPSLMSLTIKSPEALDITPDVDVNTAENPLSPLGADSIPTITSANYPPVKTSSKQMKNKAKSSSQQSSSPKQESYQPLTDGYTVSSLTTGVHPLDLVCLKMEVANLNRNETAELCVTHVENPYLTYAVLADSDNLQAVDEISDGIAEFMDRTNPIPNFHKKCGTICAVIDEKNKWRRAIATEVTDTHVTVFLMDFGSSYTYPHEDIKPLSKKFKKFAAQVIPLKLITVQPKDGSDVWSNEAIDFYRGLVFGHAIRVRRKYKKGVLTGVRMKLAQNGNMVEKLLEEGGHADIIEPEIPEDEEPKKFEPRINLAKGGVPFDHIVKEIPIQEPPQVKQFEAVITCVVSPRLFYGQLYIEENIRKVDSIGDQLKALYEDDECNDNNKLVVGKLCAIKYTDELWYRGFVLDIKPNTDITVYLVDYGIKHTTLADNVRCLPTELADALPAQAITMQMQYLTPPGNAKAYSSESVVCFQELVEFKRVKVEVLKRHGLIYRVKMNVVETGEDVCDVLINKGLASSIFEKTFIQNGRGRGGFRGRGFAHRGMANGGPQRGAARGGPQHRGMVRGGPHRGNGQMRGMRRPQPLMQYRPHMNYYDPYGNDGYYESHEAYMQRFYDSQYHENHRNERYHGEEYDEGTYNEDEQDEEEKHTRQPQRPFRGPPPLMMRGRPHRRYPENYGSREYNREYEMDDEMQYEHGDEYTERPPPLMMQPSGMRGRPMMRGGRYPRQPPPPHHHHNNYESQQERPSRSKEARSPDTRNGLLPTPPPQHERRGRTPPSTPPKKTGLGRGKMMYDNIKSHQQPGHSRSPSAENRKSSASPNEERSRQRGYEEELVEGRYDNKHMYENTKATRHRDEEYYNYYDESDGYNSYYGDYYDDYYYRGYPPYHPPPPMMRERGGGGASMRRGRGGKPREERS